MVNLCGRPQLSRPSWFSAKSLGRRHETAIVFRPGFRESGDCEPCAAEFLGECGATALLHRCPRVARRQVHFSVGTGSETERTSMAGMRRYGTVCMGLPAFRYSS